MNFIIGLSAIFAVVSGLDVFGIQEGTGAPLADERQHAASLSSGQTLECCSSGAVGGIEDYPDGNPRCGELEEGKCDIMEVPSPLVVPPSPGGHGELQVPHMRKVHAIPDLCLSLFALGTLIHKGCCGSYKTTGAQASGRMYCLRSINLFLRSGII